MSSPEDGTGPWTVYVREREEGKLEKKYTYTDSDIAVEMADEILIIFKSCEVVVKDSTGRRIYTITD